MNRRNALKMLGVLVAYLGGRAIATGEQENDGFSLSTGPYDFSFGEDGVRNIIIERKDKPNLVIPFKDIVKALEDA